ncbi:hypothetical protein nbrc107696_40290 [Gordonia spumicola]|uniref:DNA-binding protein HupB n=1 Tax=Gordonia spumicola TaxID=589161 RepID=A0A7I9VEN7_9ACTN|nr:HU family DNA-binding protein [Gordonia spumicola]GEE03583.1 hypothetical protein nbrc107696_40290 [Gordonia spumicola]
MNKAELVEELTKRLDADRKTATAAVEQLIDTIVRAVHRGESVTITGFGVFEKRSRAARVARNPRTGETVRVEATDVPSFRPGAQFKAIIAGDQEISDDQPAVKRATPEPEAPAAAKRAPAKKSAAKKSPAKKTAAKKTAAKKTAAKKTAAKKTAAKKAPATKSAAKKAASK